MNKLTLLKTLLALCAIFIYSDLLEAHNWPGWRGDGQGISSETNLPLKWSDDEGIKWKIPIPGAGHSSPIYFFVAVNTSIVLKINDFVMMLSGPLTTGMH